MSPFLKNLLFCFMSVILTVTEVAAEPLSATQELKILRILPVGEVEVEAQLVIQFDQPVVPLGKNGAEPEQIPVKIDPPLSCTWRWLNRSALACDLPKGETLKAATTYHLFSQQDSERKRALSSKKK